MMPGDSSMASIVQRIARQALVTFRNPPVVGEEASKSFLENHSKLRSLMSEVRATDLKLVPRRADDSGAPPPQHPYHRGVPPVTYMHICETEVFSMGVFLLRTGASIPLHDHPGMNGMLKVLYGKVNVRCCDKLEKNLTVSTVPPVFDPPLAPLQMASVWRAMLGSVVEYSENSGPCLLTPARNNLHQIYAVDGPAAFLDILAPPYNPDDGRDCHYYKVLQSALETETDVKGHQKQQGEKEKEEEVWLLEIPQPEDFWCGGESYPGPEVSV